MERPRVTFTQESHDKSEDAASLPTLDGQGSSRDRRSSDKGRRRSKESKRGAEEDDAPAYYDSRASTQFEYRRRATTLREYYAANPDLLPQLPFTLRHGWRRTKIGLMALAILFDTCIVPIILYYAMTVASGVKGWITFAVMSSLWGGLTYVEFAARSFRLIKPERFYRPIGIKDNRWTFDSTHYVFIVAITAVTALLIVGSAPHDPFVRVLAMPGPALLYCFAIPIFLETIWYMKDWKAPFRISSTGKGEAVRPGVYYIIEDIIAVDGNAGRPFREGIDARYEASLRFRLLMRNISLFWSIPALIVAIVCTALVCVHEVKKEVAYGLGWGIPFAFATIWGLATTPIVQRELDKEEREWEIEHGKDTASGPKEAAMA